MLNLDLFATFALDRWGIYLASDDTIDTVYERQWNYICSSPFLTFGLSEGLFDWGQKGEWVWEWGVTSGLSGGRSTSDFPSSRTPTADMLTKYGTGATGGVTVGNEYILGKYGDDGVSSSPIEPCQGDETDKRSPTSLVDGD